MAFHVSPATRLSPGTADTLLIVKAMNALLLKKTCLWLFLLGILALFCWPAARRNSNIKAVENAIDRDWEISFDRTGSHPASLPSFVDSAAKTWFDWRYAATGGYDGSQPVKTRNRDSVYYERFQCLFRDPIEYINIGYPETFRGDNLGAALARFPELRFFGVFENEDTGPGESEWTALCRRLRALPRLEEIELGGSWITDAAIEPLGGHPNLRVVTILEGRLTPGCAKTFSTIPHLATLHIEWQRHDGDTWLTPEEERTMKAALPGVTLEVP